MDSQQLFMGLRLENFPGQKWSIPNLWDVIWLLEHQMPICAPSLRWEAWKHAKLFIFH